MIPQMIPIMMIIMMRALTITMMRKLAKDWMAIIATTSTNLAKPIISLSMIKTLAYLFWGDKKMIFKGTK